MVAFNRDGTLDRSFGERGTASIAAGSQYGKTSYDNVKVLPSGKVLVTGYVAGSWVVSRFDSNGNLDGTFGTGGTATLWKGETDCASGCNDFSRFAVRRNRIFATTVPDYGSGVLVAKLTSDGRRVESFRRNGIATIPRKAALSAMAVVGGRHPFFSTGGIAVTKDLRPTVVGYTTVTVKREKGRDKDVATAIALDRRGELVRKRALSIGSTYDGYYSAVISSGSDDFFIAGGPWIQASPKRMQGESRVVVVSVSRMGRGPARARG